MIRIVAFVACFALFACDSGQGDLDPKQNPANTLSQDKAAVREAFDSYRKALLSGDGESAARKMDRKTIRWYLNALKKARLCNLKELERENFVSKLAILRLRHEFTAKELLKLDAPAVVAHAVREEWIAKSSMSSMELAKVDVMGNTAHIYIKRIPGVPVLKLAKEEGEWKLSLYEMINAGSQIFDKRVHASGKSASEFILDLLPSLSTKRVDRMILHGPLP